MYFGRENGMPERNTERDIHDRVGEDDNQQLDIRCAR